MADKLAPQEDTSAVEPYQGIADLIEITPEERIIAEGEPEEEFTPYQERAILLAWLATIYVRAGDQAHLMPATDPEPGFQWVLCLHVEGRQHGWHIADEDVRLFTGIPWLETSHYDGHTTAEKYQHLRELVTDRPSSI